MVETTIQTFDGNVGIGTNDPGSNKLKVTGGTTSLEGLSVTSSLSVGGVTNAHVPSGLIIMWHGETIPTGWSLCDGTSPTPDLRDRFILSKGNSSSIGDTGGANNLSIDGSTLPSHTHSVSTSQDGSHSHTINALASYATTHNHTLTASVEPAHSHASNLDGGDHTHAVNTNQVSHQHNASTNNANSGHQHWQGLYIQQPNVLYADGKSSSYPSILGHFLDQSYQNTTHNQSGDAHKANQGTGKYYISEDRGHNHNASLVANNLAHTHPAPASAAATSSHTHNITSISQVSNHTHDISNNVDSVSHGHTVQHGSSGNHTHTSTTNSSGQSGTVVKMPVYYALAFIMKD